MAYSAADLSPDELAWAADDKPMLGSNAAFGALSDSQWSATVAGEFGVGDITDANYPIARLFDGLPGIVTQAGSTETAYSICLDFGATGIEFDGIAYMQHNLQSEGCTALVLQIADSDDYTVNPLTLSTLAPSGESSDARLADLVLESGGGTARRYSAVRYARITMAKGANFDPTIGQIVFLRRRQLSHQPNRPWDDLAHRGRVGSHQSRGGVFYDTTHFRGQREIAADLGHLKTAIQTEISAWWDEILQGTRMFVWVDKPDATPAGFNLMRLADPSIDFPYLLGGGSRDLSLNALEQGPTFKGIE